MKRKTPTICSRPKNEVRQQDELPDVWLKIQRAELHHHRDTEGRKGKFRHK